MMSMTSNEKLLGRLVKTKLCSTVVVDLIVGYNNELDAVGWAQCGPMHGNGTNMIGSN